MSNRDNRTETGIEIHPLISKRSSPRAFSEEAVATEELESLLEAARWAPSAMNEQPWRFVYATKEQPEAYNRLLSTLVEANQVWARNAPVLLLTVAKTTYTMNGAPNPHAWHDTGLATANLALQATEQGLSLHVMGGFSASKAREVLGIPDGYDPVAVIAIGYRGDADTLPDNLKARELAPRSRKPLQELVHAGTWNI